MGHKSSVSKVIVHYLGAVALRPFTLDEERVVPPEKLVVSPLIRRGYTCPAGCGACCPRFDLVWLPHEQHPPDVQPFNVRIDGKARMLLRDEQKGNRGHYCRHLDQSDGRCGIHGSHPMSCDFELIRFIVSDDQARLAVQAYPRGWNMLNINGTRGVSCEILDATPESTADSARKLRRLQEWANYLSIPTHLDAVVEYVEHGSRTEPLRLSS